MTVSLPESAAESVRGGLGDAARRFLQATGEGKDAVGMGPGLGRDAATAETLRHLAAEITVPLVLDADALNAHAGRLETLARRQAPTVLTPHPGEMGRLLGWTTATVSKDRLAAVRQAAEVSAAVVVLKGRQTLVAAPGAAVAVNPTGNPGMATGGSGDVLTGLLTALLAQGREQGQEPRLEARDAACLAVYLHGLAGDLAAQTVGQAALAAGDLVDFLGRAYARLARDFAAA
jgi:NAD(P)H-hydrate epimerase